MIKDGAKKIEIFRELTIIGPSHLLSNFMKTLKASVKGMWTSVEINEDYYGGNTYCFKCEESPSHPAAKLWFAQLKPTKVYVSNIVPCEARKLSRAEYNQILQEFYEHFVHPLENDVELEIVLEADFVGLEHWLDEEAVERLNSFSHLANKSTGTGHPLDERRWLLFVFYVHEKGFYPNFYPEVLSRWLHEVLGWGEASASSLGNSYERTLRVLEQYDIFCETKTLP